MLVNRGDSCLISSEGSYKEPEYPKALFICRFTNDTHETVTMGLFGKDHEYRTQVLDPHSSETTDDHHLILGSDRVAVAFNAGAGKVMASREMVINQDTGVSLIQSTNGGLGINFVGISQL